MLFVLVTGCGGGGGGKDNGTIPPQTLVSIAVTPNNSSIALGATQQFTATGTYSDNTTQDLTSLVSWTSSNTSIAAISNTGLATPVATGTIIITATSGAISGSATLTVPGGDSGANNVLPITVNGSLCSVNSYPNKPCVSIMVCTPGSTACQVISDILLDTGSYGLRIFKQALNISLAQVTSGSGSVAECVQYSDGSSNWGPIQTASVVLGNEPAVQVPVQVIDSTFSAAPAACQHADQSPSVAGFNGVLGVGLFTQDCGPPCANSANNGVYYSCSGSGCSGTAVALSQQVQNPAALLPQDNNGVIVQLPGIPPEGAPAVNGFLVLGIDTRFNNASSGATTYAANQYGEFTTNLDGISFIHSFIDSGSNGLFFTPPSTSPLPNCPSPLSDWFCPSSIASLSATNTGAFGFPSGLVPFQIGNFASLIRSSNNVFNDISGFLPGGFDWGLPFCFGRNVYVGFEGKGSSLGTGPYWAY